MIERSKHDEVCTESCGWWECGDMDIAEWTREGRLNAISQVGTDGIQPLTWNAHDGVR